MFQISKLYHINCPLSDKPFELILSHQNKRSNKCHMINIDECIKIVVIFQNDSNQKLLPFIFSIVNIPLFSFQQGSFQNENTMEYYYPINKNQFQIPSIENDQKLTISFFLKINPDIKDISFYEGQYYFINDEFKNNIVDTYFNVKKALLKIKEDIPKGTLVIQNTGTDETGEFLYSLTPIKDYETDFSTITGFINQKKVAIQYNHKFGEINLIIPSIPASNGKDPIICEIHFVSNYIHGIRRSENRLV